MKKQITRILLIILVISINIGCDQSTKYLAKKHLAGAGTSSVVGDIFILRYTENRGAFLSILATAPETLRVLLLLVAPAIALLLATCYAIFQESMRLPQLASLCCLLGGGISNVMIDRLLNNGYVIDFMNIGIGAVRTGIFNFADLSIVFGSGAILVHAFGKKSG